MATRKKKRVTKVKFELTKSAIGGIGVVCFCIFLWMFLLGVWAGQSLLLPSSPGITSYQEGKSNVQQTVVNLQRQKKTKPGE